MLDHIRKKVEAGQRLSAAEGGFLFRPETDLHEVGELADIVRRRENGNAAYYNLNAHLNPTNVCAYRCALCAYSQDKDDPGAYAMDIDEILKRGREAAEAGCTELHIVGGVHPEKPYAWYFDMIRELHAAFPQLHLKAWTAVEIDWFARLTGRKAEAVLVEMIEAGLGSLPGGGAEIFNPEIRTKLCPRKIDGQSWLDVHRTAHRLGLRSNATMLYGHLEGIGHRVDHLIELRWLQDESGGFQAFVPLAFHPENTQLLQHWQNRRHSEMRRASPLVDLRVIAVARLLLDNFRHIKAYWISLGVGVAQTALAYGADDLDGTVCQERIHHAAGSKTPEELTIDEIRRLIIETGREPVERDSLYRPVNRESGQWAVDGGQCETSSRIIPPASGLQPQV